MKCSPEANSLHSLVFTCSSRAWGNTAAALLSIESHLKAPDASPPFCSGVVVSFAVHVPVRLLKLKTGPRSNEWQKNVLVFLVRAKQHLVWSVVIYVKKWGWTWSPESHHYTNGNTLHWHFRFPPVSCASLVVLNHVVLVFNSVLKLSTSLLRLSPLVCPVFHLWLTSRAKIQECAKVLVHSSGDIYTVTAL